MYMYRKQVAVRIQKDLSEFQLKVNMGLGGFFGTDSHGNQFPIVTSYSNHNNVVYDKMSTQSCDHSL